MRALAKIPEVEVAAKAQRRRFTAEYKRKILQEVDACTESGQIGAILRRESLYSSHLADWRRAREQGERDALTPKKRGRKPQVVDERDRKIVELEKQLARQTARAEKAEAIVEIQKKVGQLLGIEMADPSSTEKS
jgi:transposase